MRLFIFSLVAAGLLVTAAVPTHANSRAMQGFMSGIERRIEVFETLVQNSINQLSTCMAKQKFYEPDTAHPDRDADGCVRYVASTAPCNADNRGATRYNATLDRMEYCNSADMWAAMGGSGGWLYGL